MAVTADDSGFLDRWRGIRRLLTLPAARAWLPLPFHVVLCSAAMFALSFIFDVMSSEYDGVLSWIGYLVPAVMAGVSVFAVVIVGIPLRIVPSLRRWWMRHGVLSFALSGFGILALVASYFVGSSGPVREPGIDANPAFTVYAPDFRLFLVGWFTVAFGLAHLWWPGPSLFKSRTSPVTVAAQS